jgi:hypothetical protein
MNLVNEMHALTAVAVGSLPHKGRGNAATLAEGYVVRGGGVVA